LTIIAGGSYDDYHVKDSSGATIGMWFVPIALCRRKVINIKNTIERNVSVNKIIGAAIKCINFKYKTSGLLPDLLGSVQKTGGLGMVQNQ